MNGKRRIRVKYRVGNKKTLWQYVLSNAGLILISSLLLFLIMSAFFVRSLDRADQKHQVQKMQSAVEDIQNQFEVFQQIRSKIANNAYYHPSFREQNAYLQTNIIEDLGKYSNYSSISRDHFFFYQQEEWGYRKSGKAFISALLKEAGIGDMQAALAEMNTQKQYSIYRENGTLLLSFKVNLGSSKAVGYICFVVEEAELLERLRFVSGISELCCSLSVDGIPLLETECQQRLQTVQAGQFVLTAALQPSNYSAYLETYLYLELALIMLFLLCIGFLMAWRNWKRIHRISLKLGNMNETDDLAMLEQSIADFQKNEETYRILRGQFKATRQQTVCHMMQLMLDYPVYMERNNYFEYFERIASRQYYLPVLFAQVPSDGRDWAQEMEAMADDTMSITVIGWKNIHYAAMLINTDDSQIRQQIEEMLREIVGVQETPLQAAYGRLTDCAADIPGIFSELMADMLRSGEIEFSRTFIADYLEAIKKHSAHMLGQASAQLSREITAAFPAQCFQNACLALWKESMMKQFHQCSIEEENWYDVLAYDQIENYLIKVAQQIESVENKSGKQLKIVLDTIQRQYLSYDCSADSLSDTLHISIRQINRILKDATGRTFKDYLIQLRIDEACRLLRETDMSIADVMKASGYVSASQFFKSFSALIGKTPSVYRKEYWEEQLEKHNLNR